MCKYCTPRYKQKGYRLRHYVGERSPIITDSELIEIETLIDFKKVLKELNLGDIIFTKNPREWKEAVSKMCCQIEEKRIHLASGYVVYFAYDCGH